MEPAPRIRAAALVLLAAACGRPAADAGGTAAAPKRIVALGHTGVYETLLDFGAFDRIVAVGDRNRYPGSESKVALKQDGDGVPNMETVLSLAPDLVIIRQSARATVEAAGLRVFLVPERDDVPALEDFIGKLGHVLGEDARAAEILAGMRAAAARLAARTKDLPRVRVYYEEPNPFMSHARGAFADDMIAACGGDNIAGDMPTLHPLMNAEYIVHADPEVIVLGAFTDKPDAVALRAGWGRISAVKNGRVFQILPHDRLLWSSRWAERAERMLLPWLHPGAAALPEVR